MQFGVHIELACGRTVGAPCGLLTCQDQQWGQLPSAPGLEPVLPKVAPPAAFSPIRAGPGC